MDTKEPLVSVTAEGAVGAERLSWPAPLLGPQCHCCGCQWHVSTVSSERVGDTQRPAAGFPADVPRAAVHPQRRTLRPESRPPFPRHPRPPRSGAGEDTTAF